MFPEVAVGNGVIVFMFGVLLLLRNGVTQLENRKLLGKSIRTKGKVVDLVYDDGEMLACQLLVEFQAIDGKTYRVKSSTSNVAWKKYLGKQLYITYNRSNPTIAKIDMASKFSNRLSLIVSILLITVGVGLVVWGLEEEN